MLVELAEHGGDLPLPERVVERIVDQLRRHAQAADGVAVDRFIIMRGAEALQIAGHIGELRQHVESLASMMGAHLNSSAASGSCKVYWYWVFCSRACRSARPDARLAEERDARKPLGRLAQAGHDLGGGRLALV